VVAALAFDCHRRAPCRQATKPLAQLGRAIRPRLASAAPLARRQTLLAQCAPRIGQGEQRLLVISMLQPRAKQSATSRRRAAPAESRGIVALARAGRNAPALALRVPDPVGSPALGWASLAGRACSAATELVPQTAPRFIWIWQSFSVAGLSPRSLSLGGGNALDRLA
jgi:hypothetical protein